MLSEFVSCSSLPVHDCSGSWIFISLWDTLIEDLILMWLLSYFRDIVSDGLPLSYSSTWRSRCRLHRQTCTFLRSSTLSHCAIWSEGVWKIQASWVSRGEYHVGLGGWPREAESTSWRNIVCSLALSPSLLWSKQYCFCTLDSHSSAEIPRWVVTNKVLWHSSVASGHITLG